jgi:uncharacterized OB-fold protein
MIRAIALGGISSIPEATTPEEPEPEAGEKTLMTLMKCPNCGLMHAPGTQKCALCLTQLMKLNS